MQDNKTLNTIKAKQKAAVIDGELHDTYDSTRDGDCCVYGYFIKAEAAK